MTVPLDERRERTRLDALHAFAILDSAPEGPFDDVAALASALLEVPMATVTFVDAERQWFKAAIGLDLREGARSEAFCAHTIDGTTPFVVEDAQRDERFTSSALVVGASAVRAYAGAPIVTHAGLALGAVSAFDTRPRTFSEPQLAGLERLARLTMQLLEERSHRHELDALTAERHDELQRAHELMLSHLDNTPLAVVEWDETFRVRRWTRSAEAVFGWTPEQVLGKRPESWRFVHPDDAADVGSVMDALLEQRSPRNVSRNRNFTRDGRVITCDWYNSVLSVPGGGKSILSLVEDVTDEIENERRAHTAQRLEAVGQLTGGMAHDFNNLLSVIIGNAEQLEAQLEAAEPRRVVGTILDAAGRGAELVGRLLAFARRQPLSPTIRDVDALIRDMLPLLQRTLGEAIALEVRTAGVFPCTASVDAHAFEGALLNLVLNARYALPRGGRVVISTRVETLGPAQADGVGVTPGRYVLTAVEDGGDGVPAELVERVWEPFFTTKPSGEGSGMGLAMVYGFARQSRGFTRLRSALGRGTTVTLALPWDGGQVERRRGDHPVLSERGSEHILVVEDNDLVREMVQMQLTSLGYTVTAVGDGAEALASLAADTTIELVFSDVVMPGGMSGHDLVAELRRRRPDLPVLLTSGYDGAAGDASTAVERAGAPGVGVLKKPYRREDLAARVRVALEQGKA